jgi:hypothetical protein
MKHKHAEVIKAFVDGIECEVQGEVTGIWHPALTLLAFELHKEARIKPIPKPDTVDYLFVADKDLIHVPEINWVYEITANLKLTWDGETSKLKNAEVIK